MIRTANDEYLKEQGLIHIMHTQYASLNYEQLDMLRCIGRVSVVLDMPTSASPDNTVPTPFIPKITYWVDTCNRTLWAECMNIKHPIRQGHY